MSLYNSPCAIKLYLNWYDFIPYSSKVIRDRISRLAKRWWSKLSPVQSPVFPTQCIYCIRGTVPNCIWAFPSNERSQQSMRRGKSGSIWRTRALCHMCAQGTKPPSGPAQGRRWLRHARLTTRVNWCSDVHSVLISLWCCLFTYSCCFVVVVVYCILPQNGLAINPGKPMNWPTRADSYSPPLSSFSALPLRPTSPCHHLCPEKIRKPVSLGWVSPPTPNQAFTVLTHDITWYLHHYCSADWQAV